jgi:hypothetical protein
VKIAVLEIVEQIGERKKRMGVVLGPVLWKEKSGLQSALRDPQPLTAADKAQHEIEPIDGPGIDKDGERIL